MITDTAICNFADDTTIFAANSCLDNVVERLETDAQRGVPKIYEIE